MQKFDFNSLFKENAAPILDVRAPSEYAAGHIPGAISFPLFSDEERAEIGTTYKQVSAEDAIEKGLEHVGPKLARFVREAKLLAPNKAVTIYCWRGGMRSGSMEWLLKFAGFKVHRISGGYKAYRHWIAEIIENFSSNGNWKVVGGMTGSGKTNVLHALRNKGEQVIDLEGLANHKGSAFGHFLEDPQPSTEHFMNVLAVQLSKMDLSKSIWIEDESRMIGSVVLPPPIYEAITRSFLFNLDIEISQRANTLAEQYGEAPLSDFERAYQNISKRLGGHEVRRALELIQAGELAQAAEIALRYYDKAYQHSISKRADFQQQLVLPASGLSPEKVAELLIRENSK